MVKAKELRDLTQDELLEKEAALRKEHFQLRVQAKLGKLEKQHQLKAIRRDIARVLTMLSEFKQKGASANL